MDVVFVPARFQFIHHSWILFDEPLEEKVVEEPSAQERITPGVFHVQPQHVGHVACAAAEVDDQQAAAGVTGGDVPPYQVVDQGPHGLLHGFDSAESGRRCDFAESVIISGDTGGGNPNQHIELRRHPGRRKQRPADKVSSHAFQKSPGFLFRLGADRDFRLELSAEAPILFLVRKRHPPFLFSLGAKSLDPLLLFSPRFPQHGGGQDGTAVDVNGVGAGKRVRDHAEIRAAGTEIHAQVMFAIPFHYVSLFLVILPFNATVPFCRTGFSRTR